MASLCKQKKTYAPARGGKCTPSPYPPFPLAWKGVGGGGARWQSIPVGPRWLNEGLREPKVASKTAQDTSRRLKVTSDIRGSKAAPRRFQAPSEPSKDPQQANIAPNPDENLESVTSRGFASDGFLTLEDGPKKGQERPKRGLRSPQDGPKSAHECSKSCPRGPPGTSFEPPGGGAG